MTYIPSLTGAPDSPEIVRPEAQEYALTTGPRRSERGRGDSC